MFFYKRILCLLINCDAKYRETFLIIQIELLKFANSIKIDE